MIEGITPCHPEVLAVIEALVNEFEENESQDGLDFVFEQDISNPNMFSVAALDEAGYANAGIVGWIDEEQALGMFCHKPAVENHDRAEGIPEEQSACWWRAPSLEMFIMFLDGTVREIVMEDMKKG